MTWMFVSLLVVSGMCSFPVSVKELLAYKKSDSLFVIAKFLKHVNDLTLVRCNNLRIVTDAWICSCFWN